MGTARFVDWIHRKRQGGELSDAEIKQMIEEYVSGQIPDYQMAAMLMAIYFQGMNDRELTTLTLVMRDSGDVVDLSPIPGIIVDKHSTGGVGDKITLVLGPVVAACGVPVAKMSGRGLGFTGGTLDKLESIPGFRIDLSQKDFFEAVKTKGLSVIGQTGNLAPADKLLYALRDVTATVESIPLIAASIMSKKLAAGSDKIVLDVTTGSGAFIKDLKDSRELAKRMVAIGNGAGKETVALITSMDEPLGQAVGNNLEVKEAMEILQNRGPADVREVATALAGMMISLGRDTTYECGKMLAEEALNKGRAWEKFKAMVENQGGDLSYIENPDRFDVAAFSREIKAPKAGYITGMQTEQIGVAAGVLGAGREKKDSKVDYSAGILVYKKIGAYVEPGDVMAVLYTNREDSLDTAGELYLESVQIDDVKPELPQLIVDIIR